jgi:hypothetical protein
VELEVTQVETEGAVRLDVDQMAFDQIDYVFAVPSIRFAWALRIG